MAVSSLGASRRLFDVCSSRTALMRRAPRRSHRVRDWLVSLLVGLTLLFGPNGLLTALSTLAPPTRPIPHTTTSLIPLTQAQALANQAATWGDPTVPDIQPLGSYQMGESPQGTLIPRAVLNSPPVVVAKIPLKATVSTSAVTGDQRFSITIPAGALTSQELTQVGGPAYFQITRLSGPMGGGASGLVSLGTYRLEVLGPHGLIPGLAFQQPVTFQLRYTPQEALAIVPTAIKMSLVSALPQGTMPLPTEAPAGNADALSSAHATQELVAFTSQPNAALSGQATLAPLFATGRADVSITGPSPFDQQPTIQNFQNNLNAGALTYQYPVSLPPGPGGFVPPLALSYSSAMVNQSYSLTADAPWVGEGWSLDLGSITWSEENEASGCHGFTTLSGDNAGWENCNPAAVGGQSCNQLGTGNGPVSIYCPNQWANSWTLSLNGQSMPLIPQDTNWATGPDAIDWEGLTYNPSQGWNVLTPFTVVNPPAQWYTAPESHAKILELNCTTDDLTRTPWTHPCWRVWLPSGEMLEFGATDDSVEYGIADYTGLDGLSPRYFQYVYSWKLDAMVDPHGNQIHITYRQYTNTISYATYSGDTVSLPYVQDAEIATVSYDSPTCLSTTVICASGSSTPTLWQPLVQVVFDQGTGVTRLTGGDSACQGWTDPYSRCDESYSAVDIYSHTSSMTNIAVLNAIEVQVRPSSTSSWGLLRAYALSYEQTASPWFGTNAYIGRLVAGTSTYLTGYLDLTKIQEFGTDWTGNSTNTGTSLPPMILSYLGSPSSEYYYGGCSANSALTCSDDSVLQERYIDPLYQNIGDDNYIPPCVPWASTTPDPMGTRFGCNVTLYQETYNQRYLAEVDNGEGVQETFTWQEGHMNVEGVPAGRSVTNPFSCTASDLSTLPCAYADAQHWSRILLVARDTKVQETIGGATVTVDHHWSYNYAMAAVQSQNNWCAPGDCQATWDWGNVDDGDYLDFYNAEFRGFQQVQEVEQEIDSGGGACTTACTLSVTDHTYITTQGWGVWNQAELAQTSGSPPLVLYQDSCPNVIIFPGATVSPTPITTSCPTSPYWASGNMPAGAETQTDVYASDGTTLLRRTLNSYDLNCAPVGDPTTPARGSDGNWYTLDPPDNLTHLLVAEPDPENPIAVCDPRIASTQTLLVDGGSLSTAPSTTVTYSYDTGQSYSGSHDYGNVTVIDTVASDGGTVGGPGQDSVQTIDYTVNDSISAGATWASGVYIINTPSQKAIHSGSATGPIQQLTRLFYDGATSLTAPPTTGTVWQTSVAANSSGSSYTFLTTTSAYDPYGNLLAVQQPNGQMGACTLTITVDGQPQSQGFSTCYSYDTSSYTAHVTQVTNALGQTTSTNTLGSGAAYGFGEWLQSSADANNQTTSYQYDALGRQTGVVAPGEGSNLLTIQYVYTIWCPATGPSLPCSETDTIERYNSTTTVTSRSFYDGWGQVVETRAPADSSHDVVTYTTYDAREEALFSSRPYYVSAYSGSPSSGAYSTPDTTQLGEGATFDALGRQIQATDPAGATSTTSYLQLTGPDGATYEATQMIDANLHQNVSLQDALGRTRYTETFTGTSSPYTLYATTAQSYDYQGNLVTITHPDGVHTTTISYDLAGRQIGTSDPDSGTTTEQVDNDGNVIQETDARGDTVYAGYDALDRPLWRNTTNSPNGAYVTYSYDGTVPTGVSCSGITPTSNAVGQVTTEQFTSGPNNSFSGTYCYAYDARGELTGEVDTLAGTTYQPILWAYNDAGVLSKVTYPTGEYAQYNYSNQQRLTSVTRFARGVTNYLIPSITYNGAPGAAGLPDSYVVGGTGSCAYATSSTLCASLSYDNDLRQTQATYTTPTSSSSITDYSQSVTYDPVGNITSVSAGLPAAGGQSGGQDNQQFCYDDLDRLIWAGDTGTNPCTNQTVNGTTLSAATYTASYQYDSSSRLTQSTLTGTLATNPQGSYTYDSTHYHAVDAIGSSTYTAQYDASGDMTCRAPTSVQQCTSSSQTGAQLTYDAEGRLIEWVSANGATTVKYGYDGEGNRFEMQVTSGSTTTTTTYIGDLEEVQTVGSSTTKITYFYCNGLLVAEDDNTHWYYPITDSLTSTTVMVDYTGVTAAQLFGPYGQARWAGGTMPTSYAYTGQRADGATGLDYYNARYYDPSSGRFTSADSVVPGGGLDPRGMDAYAYAADSPATNIDPSGHDFCGSFLGFLCTAATNLWNDVSDFLNLPEISTAIQAASDRSLSPGQRTFDLFAAAVLIVNDAFVVGDAGEKLIQAGGDLLDKALNNEVDQTAADVADAAGRQGGDVGDAGGSSGGGGGSDGQPLDPNKPGDAYTLQVRQEVGDNSLYEHADPRDPEFHPDAIASDGRRIETKLSDNGLFGPTSREGPPDDITQLTGIKGTRGFERFQTGRQLARYSWWENGNFQYWFQSRPDPRIVNMIRYFGGRAFLWSGLGEPEELFGRPIGRWL